MNTETRNFEKNGFAIIDTDTLCDNYRKLAAFMGGAAIIPVIKGNCYGYGTDGITAALTERCGVKTVAVGALCEGLQMRHHGASCEIMLVGGIAPQQYPLAVENHIIVSLFRPDCAAELERCCVSSGLRAQVQLAIDTGMHRLGAAPGAPLEALLSSLRGCPHIDVAGVYTHFATATHCADDPLTLAQHQLFLAAMRQVEAAGLSPRYVHCCNSAAALWFPAARHTHVRLGGSLYGHRVMEDGTDPVDVREILTLRAYVTNVHTLPAGQSVGYTRRFHSSQDATVATLSLGFADGIPAAYARGGGTLLVHGHRVRFLDICMDQAMVDVTGIACEVGDEVTLLGSDGGETITVGDWEAFLGTTFDRILTFLSNRVDRIYT